MTQRAGYAPVHSLTYKQKERGKGVEPVLTRKTGNVFTVAAPQALPPAARSSPSSLPEVSFTRRSKSPHSPASLGRYPPAVF